MKITFAGSGSAFTKRNYQTNLIITRNRKHFLIDAGGDIRFSLDDIGMSYKDIDALYITHLHGDHIGGLEYLAFCTFFDPSVVDKITLIANNDVTRELWSHSLQGGLKSIQGRKMTLHDYFDVQMIKRNGKFYWEDITVSIVQSVHIMDEYSIVPSYGLMITNPDEQAKYKKIYITGDSQFNPNQIIDFYKEADLIIQDCETTPYNSGVHANFMELKTLPEEIKNKMILQHYSDTVMENNRELVINKIANVILEHDLPKDESELKEVIGEFVDYAREDQWILSQEWQDNAKKEGFNLGFAKKGYFFDPSIGLWSKS